MNIPDSPDLEVINYHLPEEKIAKHPMDNRDESKLLVYNKGKLSDSSFKKVSQFLDPESTLFFNNTKVIPARLFFFKETGAQIEIFLLKPTLPTNIISVVMEENEKTVWVCMVGNFRKWKDENSLTREIEIDGMTVNLKASIVDRETKQISFEWDNDSFSFAEIVEHAGVVPLPPYLNREAEKEDKSRYQTVYSSEEGAVAAPTAGLHFTDQILSELKKRGVKESFLTLHVSAGTFQPIKVDDAREHPMHSEQIEVSIETIKDVIASKKVVSVGTTSMRSLESLYWFGVRLQNGNEEFSIEKLEIYNESDALPDRQNAFQSILDWMNLNNLKKLTGSTEIFIMPGYQFKVCDGLITNFHQPGSTLLLLVSAFVRGNWLKIYNHALKEDYRFLSYGDSSILLP